MTTATVSIQAHRIQYCSDLLSTAIEGGIGYWGKGRKFVVGEKDSSLAGNYIACQLMPHNDEGPAFKDGDYRNRWQTIDLAKMAAAVELLVAPGSKLAADHIIEDLRADWNDPDSCRFDADTADVVVQIALFGEIVFG